MAGLREINITSPSHNEINKKVISNYDYYSNTTIALRTTRMAQDE